MKVGLLWACVLMMCFCSGFAQAGEDDQDAAAVRTLETVVVSAGRVKEEKKEVTASVSVIDRETIEESSAQTLGELLSEHGLVVREYPGALTSVEIRGFRTETHGNDLKGRVLILLNGRRAGTGNAAKILTQNVERIEIIRGPASVQYGSAAVGGLINVITRRGKGKPTAFAEGFLGSWDYKEGTVGLSGQVRQIDFSGSYTYRNQGDYDTGGGEKYHNTGFHDLNNVSLNAGWTFLPHNRLGFIFTGYDLNHQGSPGYLSQNDLDDYTDKSNYSLDFIYEGGQPTGSFSWMARYYFGKDKDRWVDPTGSNPDGWDDGIPSNRDTDFQGVQAQVTKQFKYGHITAGFDWVDYDIEASWTPERTHYENPAGFLLAKAKFLDDRLIFSGGVRYDYYKVKVKEPAGSSESDDHVSPRLGLAYMLTDKVRLRVNYGEAFVMPEADQLAADFYVWGTHYVGNPDLSPEKSRTIEGGIDLGIRSLYACLTYFYTDFTGKIEPVTLPDGSSSWDNLGSATVSGLEGELSFDIGDYFDWSFELRPYARFTYLFRFEDDETGEDLLYVPDWTAAFGIAFRGWKGFASTFNFNYSGTQTVVDYESGYPYENVKLSDSLVADWTIQKRLFESEKFGRMTLKGAIRNLFDENYAYVLGYPLPGRSFYVGLRCQF